MCVWLLHLSDETTRIIMAVLGLIVVATWCLPKKKRPPATRAGREETEGAAPVH